MNLTIEDHATPALRALMTGLANRKRLMDRMGKAMEVELRAHFSRRDSEGNKHGWPSKHFWHKTVRKATAFTGATNDEATVTIASREFAQKLYGGTIRAQGGRYLAIPLTAKAYAIGRPALWPGGKGGSLRLVKGQHNAVLVENLYSTLRKKDRGQIFGGEAQYVLKKSVTQAPDPRALPSETKLANAALIAARAYLESLQP